MARHFDSYIRNDVRCALPGYITSKNAAALVGRSKHGTVLKLKRAGCPYIYANNVNLQGQRLGGRKALMWEKEAVLNILLGEEENDN